ncbi:MAG: tetratricopeptide repeat protein [Saprospiraceae bacterium]|nr:tetratricopeptide repeat protein [Saprospiraceae bacterium]
MSKTLFFLTLAMCFAHSIDAQNWKKSRKSGDELYQQGQYAQAAVEFEQAFKKKPKNKDLAFKTAESFYIIKDYRKAAEYFQYIKDDNVKYPMSGLKYARSLKQDGRYEDAKREFQAYLDKYTGADRAIMEEIIRVEIAGCDLAKELPGRANREAEVMLLSRGVNTDATEFAPIPFSNDVLYFSSTAGNKARIFRSQRQGKEWSKAGAPEAFPVIPNDHYCNGTLSADGQRFYFTICRGDESWGTLTTRCEIFLIKRQGGVWSQPTRLPDYINMDKVTATHPTVTELAGQEFLFFASNREGGRGGMDLWFVSRDLAADDTDFSFPVNLGPTVNTAGDEMTPFYDANSGVLYFASNGHPSIGGLDVFKSKGMETIWATPENIGLPFNSPADDLYYILNADGNAGFFVSNRAFGGQKNNTRDEDIFEFTIGGRRLMVKGTTYDRDSGAPLGEIIASLYQVLPGNVENLLLVKDFNDGNYSFEILPGRTFKIEIQSTGYQSASYEFASTDPAITTYGRPVYMDKMVVEPPVEVPADPNPVDKFTDNEVYTVIGIGPDDQLEYTSSAPRSTGIYYKVQLAALQKYDPGHSGLKRVSSLAGRMDTEYIPSQNLTRVMLADFTNKEEAFKVMEQVQKRDFPGAFVVRYENGLRYGKEM